MSSLRKFSVLAAGAIVLAALAAISVPHKAKAQTATPTPVQSAAPARPPVVTQTPADLALMQHALLEPREIAAAVVAADNPAPKYVVEVGAYQGAFLAVFLDKFPSTRGQWTEPVTNNEDNAKRLLAKFGNRVNYKIGCAHRDISDGCVPKDADVIITDWVTTHQPLDGMYKIFHIAYDQLPKGGWIVNIDHVAFGGSAWEHRLQTALIGIRPAHEGPPFENPNDRVPTAEEQIGALRAAGFDAQVVWKSFTTCLFMGRKN
jgi:hypothetical protein